MSLLRFFLFSFLRPFCSAEWDRLGNFARGSEEEHKCEIILKYGKAVQMSFDFFFYF